MVFSVGETVVYPHHGAALIEAIETRVVKGEEKQYLVLRVAQGDLTVRVPADVLSRYDRLIDLLREEEGVTRQMYVDMQRLVSAYVVSDDE